LRERRVISGWAPFSATILDALERFLDGIEELLRRQPAIVTLERARVARYGGPTRAMGGAEEDAP
jgi:hypothetical protein